MQKALKNHASNLILSDCGTTEAGNILNSKVSWKIKDQNIGSFKIVEKRLVTINAAIEALSRLQHETFSVHYR